VSYKGRGFPEVENELNWHGKPLGPKEEVSIQAVEALIVDPEASLTPIAPTETLSYSEVELIALPDPTWAKGEGVATRAAYGKALVALGTATERAVVLDADTKNSTMTLEFA
jgi:transketolase